MLWTLNFKVEAESSFTFIPHPYSSFLPMHFGPLLGIKQLRIKLHISTHVRILLRRHNLAIDDEDHFRRHPSPAEFLILVELRLLCLRSILSSGTKHSDKVKILLI